MRIAISVALLTTLSAVPASAKHWHEEKGWRGDVRHDGPRAVAREDEECYFRPADIRIVREYYAPRYRRLPPGLAKKYYRTGQLPPGWQKKMQPLPVAVERQLVVLPPEYRRGYIDGAVVVYSPRTQVVVDIVRALGR